MIDFILKIVQDENVLERFAQAIAVYILVLWLLFPIWVFIDAKKMFESTILALIFALFILPLNIPGLIFYIIIRPERHDDFDMNYDEGENSISGPITNIPLTTFSHDGQVAMSINLKINTDLINKEDADLNITMQSNHEKEKHKNQKEEDAINLEDNFSLDKDRDSEKNEEKDEKISFVEYMQQRLSKIKERLDDFFKSAKQEKEDSVPQPKEEKDEKDEAQEESDDDVKSKKNKKKNKKHKKNKNK